MSPGGDGGAAVPPREEIEAVAWEALPAGEVLRALGSRPQGLDPEEARRRLERFGPNRLPEPARRPAWRRFLAQFRNLLIYVLLAAGAVTAALGHWLDSGVILGVVLLNAFIGFVQEGRAERALEGLRRMLSPRAVVRRGGRARTVPAEELVVGDVVLLAAGDRVPADLRLLRAHELAMDESLLTGESVPVPKDPSPVATGLPVAERRPMAFSGTLVVRGQAEGVVVATGEATEVGRIGRLLREVRPLATPLVAQMERFARTLTVVVLALAAATFAVGGLRGFPWAEMFLASVGLAVAAIPEGLPAILTIALAVGVQRMARRHAVIRRLPAVETLGAVTVICTDKTGTLTRNEMTVTAVVTAAGRVRVEGVGYEPRGRLLREGGGGPPEGDPALEDLLEAAVLCNDAEVSWDAPGEAPRVTGDPLEAALLVLAAKAGREPARLRQARPRLAALPFDARRRYMATLHPDGGEGATLYLKGAPERVFDLCRTERAPGGPRPLRRERWEAAARELAGQGLRLLALARRPARPEEALDPEALGALELLGLVGVIDPPRPEAAPAVARCREAGIAVKMVTGDHALTAEAVGRELGIGDARSTLTGQELEGLGPEALREAVAGASIFARTSPEQKLRLVEALQERGEVVAMTGDGVNDAPALRRADIGIAMGRKGSDAAREAAEMVLTDDHFATIVRAVEEGRTVYDNIRKSLLYILPTNGGESLMVLGAVAFGQVLPVTALQILWINMVTTVTLALALAFEPAEPDIMRRPPRPPREALLSPYLLWRILFVSALMVAAGYGVFLWCLDRGLDLEEARTATVNALVACEAFYLFNARFFFRPALGREGLLGNGVAWLAVGALLLVQLAFTHAPPLQALFRTTGLDGTTWALAAAAGAALFLAVELEKALARRWLGRTVA